MRIRPPIHFLTRAIEVLSYNIQGGHNFYYASVHSEKEGELFYANRAGSLRWNSHLADALAGGGFFIREEFARRDVDAACAIYKDFKPEDIIITKLDPETAIPLLQSTINEVIADMAKPIPKTHYVAY